MTREQEIEAREKATTPLTAEEYAEWKGNINDVADILLPEPLRSQYLLWHEITTTVEIQLRLFTTIDNLLAQLKDREEKLVAVRAWGQRNPYQDAWPDLRDWPGLDRILQGGK